MRCRELMKSEPVWVLPDSPVQLAAQRMSAENIGFVPVCDASGKVLGTLTDRDIAIRVVAKGASAETPVADVMSCEVVACQADEDIQEAEARMRAAQKSRILCTDGGGRLVGVISLSDIARNESDARAAATMRAVASREAPEARGREPAQEGKSFGARSILQRIEQSGALPAGIAASDAIGGVLCVLSFQAGGGEVRAQERVEVFPSMLQEIIAPCAEHLAEPPDMSSRGEFLQRLAAHFQTSLEHAETVARSVFAAVEAELPVHEVSEVEALLPQDLRELWGSHRQAA